MNAEHLAFIREVCDSLPCEIVKVPNANCLAISTPSRSAIVRFALRIAAGFPDLGRTMAESVVVLMPPNSLTSLVLDQPPVYLFPMLETDDQ